MSQDLSRNITLPRAQQLRVGNPYDLLRFLENGTYVPFLHASKGEKNNEFWVPYIKDTTQRAKDSDEFLQFKITRVFPKGAILDVSESSDGKKYCKIARPEEEEEAELLAVQDDLWKQIEEVFLNELVRIKEPILQPGQSIETIQSHSAKIYGANKLMVAYDNFDDDTQRITQNMNMIWFMDIDTKSKPPRTKQTMGVSYSLSFPTPKPSERWTKKRKVTPPETEANIVQPVLEVTDDTSDLSGEKVSANA